MWQGWCHIKATVMSLQLPLEIVFQEESYSSLHSGWSLAWDHFRILIDDPCGNWQLPMQRMEIVPVPIIAWLTKHVNHCETVVKHH